ncbi:MerR family transcriptional regulator [bacterium]|nr:MerR family transcriptional regulator [bacterium]
MPEDHSSHSELKSWMQSFAPEFATASLEPSMTISEAADRSGLSESALRKYEAAGLILYHRTSGNVRVLSKEDLERIELIQHLIKKKGLNFEGIRRLWSLLPCWEFKSCSEEQRLHCDVFQNGEKPCWMLFQELENVVVDDCRTCEVYRMAALCTEDLKSMVRTVIKGRFTPSCHTDKS